MVSLLVGGVVRHVGEGEHFLETQGEEPEGLFPNGGATIRLTEFHAHEHLPKNGPHALYKPLLFQAVQSTKDVSLPSRPARSEAQAEALHSGKHFGRKRLLHVLPQFRRGI
jgi:hypothetical protein